MKAPQANKWAATIDALMDAWNSHDPEAAAAFYAEDAVLRTDEPAVYKGRDGIVQAATLANTYGDFTMERTSDVIGRGNQAGVFERFHGTGWEGDYGLTIFRFDEEGKIVSQFSLVSP